MKEKFQREDIIFCSSLIQEGFLQVGYQNEKDRINALAKGLLKNWKEKWPGWDKNDLQKHFTGYVESGLGKIVLPELVSAFNEKYKFAKPKLKPTATIDRTQIEKDYIKDIIRNMKEADNKSYNATFTYPKGGAIEYVNAFLSEVPESLISYEEKLVAIDLEKKVATTNQREITFQHLVSSAPLNHLLRMTGVAHDEAAFSWNQVLVFNLGFDKKGPTDPHWVYFPDRNRRFYRVGFYDNIHDGDRMSLYVEIGAKHGESLDVEAEKKRVLEDLKAEGIITDHELVSWHTVTMDPAYVHITKASLAETARTKALLEESGVYPVGRYGGWTYCAIEDNIVETRALAKRLAS